MTFVTFDGYFNDCGTKIIIMITIIITFFYELLFSCRVINLLLKRVFWPLFSVILFSMIQSYFILSGTFNNSIFSILVEFPTPLIFVFFLICGNTKNLRLVKLHRKSRKPRSLWKKPQRVMAETRSHNDDLTVTLNKGTALLNYVTPYIVTEEKKT